MAGGGPGVDPGSCVQTPPETLVHEGKKSTTVNVWLSGEPPSALGPLVTFRLILTVWPTTRFRLSPFGNPMISVELQTVCACAGVESAAPTVNAPSTGRVQLKMRAKLCTLFTIFGSSNSC